MYMDYHYIYIYIYLQIYIYHLVKKIFNELVNTESIPTLLNVDMNRQQPTASAPYRCT